MAYSKDRGDAPMRRRGGRRRKKVCIFCADKNAVIDYKDTYLKEVRSYLEESQETVQNISVLLQ